ncbi:MAG: MFS transporter [Planctomycetaceae bacterium]
MHSVKDATDAAPSQDAGELRESRNLAVLIAQQMLFRTGWIFKTESVIMPAFLDSITPHGWIRGMLPPLNRFGQSITPLLLSDRISEAPRKARWVTLTLLMMSLPFLLLGASLLIVDGDRPTWYPAFFLAAYGAFFCIHGVNQATYSTIIGKLVQPDRRGRLIALAGTAGSVLAVTTAWLLMKPWTEHQPPHFSRIFLFTGTMFCFAALLACLLQETPDFVKPQAVRRRHLRDSVVRLRVDPTLRRLCLAAALFVCSQLLFPHYQRLGRQQAGYRGDMLMIWVIAQNLGAAAFSWVSGRLADSRGTRSALRCLFFSAVFAPLLPLTLASLVDAGYYWITFAWLGVVPVTFRMQMNYVLEITERVNHPIYVSTVVLCMAPPIVLSPLIGELVERIGYAIPFCGISFLVFTGWLLTLTMVEPRHGSFS